MQILRSLEAVAPEGHEHIFTLLKTDEDHKKGTDVQLTITKCMIKAHCKSFFDIEEGEDGEGGSMM